jgi:hypothetical protein
MAAPRGVGKMLAADQGLLPAEVDRKPMSQSPHRSPVGGVSRVEWSRPAHCDREPVRESPHRVSGGGVSGVERRSLPPDSH